MVECEGVPVRSRDRDHEFFMRQAVADAQVRGAAGRHCAEGVLRLRGVPDLANCDRFQREVECACDGGGNHDSASRKADHNCVLIFDPRPKLVGENAACVRAVVEREE
jgi:hypothetical protein